MWHEVRSAKGKLLFRLEAHERLIEVKAGDDLTVVDLETEIAKALARERLNAPRAETEDDPN